jgi:hypothetical protein
MVYRYKRKRKERVLKISIVLLVILVLVFSYVLFFPQAKKLDFSTLPELSTIGYKKVEIDAGVSEGRGMVTLTADCYQVIAYTETAQAESIANGLAGRIDFRPNAHDLVKSMFDSLDIEVVMVKVVGITNNTFIGKVILRQGNKILSLDSRPSDGTALAVRTGSPVYMKESLLEEYGRKVC